MEEAEAFQVGVRHLALREGTIQTNAHFTDGELRPGRASLLPASISHGSAQPPLAPLPSVLEPQAIHFPPVMKSESG